MLNQVFASEPFKYKVNEFGTFVVRGIVIQPIPALGGPDTLYMFTIVFDDSITHLGGEVYSWDAAKGAYIGNAHVTLPVFSNTSIIMSRGGILYFVGVGFAIDLGLIPFSMTDLTNDAAGTYPASRYVNGFGTGPIQLDEQVDVLMTTDGQNTLSISQLSTGKLLTQLNLPDQIIATGLQTANCMYCLCRNRMLVLVDYVQGKVLGAVKGPPSLASGNYYDDLNHTSLFWYARYGRILLAEMVPDITVEGVATAQTIIRGFSPNPIATRLTVPIPLKEPQTNRTIPVLTILVDDSNFGTSGALVGATCSGDDGTTTIPNGTYTDQQGRANIPTHCGDEAATIALECTVSV